MRPVASGNTFGIAQFTSVSRARGPSALALERLSVRIASEAEIETVRFINELHGAAADRVNKGASACRRSCTDTPCANLARGERAILRRKLTGTAICQCFRSLARSLLT